MAIDRGAGSDDPWTSARRRWHKLEAIEHDVVDIGEGVAGAVIASTSAAFPQVSSSTEDRLPVRERLAAPVAHGDRKLAADLPAMNLRRVG